MVTEPGEGPSSTGSGRAPGSAGGSTPESAGTRGRRFEPVRLVIVLTPIVAIVAGIAVVLANLPGGQPIQSAGIGDPSAPSATAAEGSSRGYLVTLEELRRRGGLATQGEEPYKAAVDDLLEWAEDALDDDPEPTQPLIVVGTENALVDDARRAYGLGLAYGLTADERFAQAARRTIRAWMDTAVTTGDTCPESGACHTSLIIGRVGAGFAFGADLIEGSEAWTPEDRADLRVWMRDVILPAASIRPTNWGDAGTFLRVVAADYAGEREAFDAAIQTWRAFIDLIEADGRIPEEVRRGSSGILYTQEALQYKVAVARIAEARGINLWDYVGARGGSLRAAIDRLAYYWHRPEEWPDHPRPRVPSIGPLWEIAYARWREPSWVDIFRDARPYGDRGHSAVRWTTLTNGIPIDPLIAGGETQGSNSPTQRASESPSATVLPTATPDFAAVPPVTGLAVRLGSPLGVSMPVAVRWDAPTIAGASVELERSTDGGSSWTPLEAGPDGHSASDAIRPGATIEWRARMVVGGVGGPWSLLTDVSVARVEASSRTATLDGSWERVAFGNYSGGGALSTDDDGATLIWLGTTQAIAIVGPTGPTRGRMVISVDGVRADVVDLRSDGYRPRVLLFQASWPTAGHHEVTIEAARVGGRRTVAVDDIVTLISTLSADRG